MHYAALCGHDEAVVQLTRAGADPTKPSNDGVTPLDSARAEGHLPVVAFFTETYTKAGGMEFSHGVVQEGDFKVKKKSGVFKWQRGYYVMSKALRALVFWRGTAFEVHGGDSMVTTVPLDDITDVMVHPASKKGGRRVDVWRADGSKCQLLYSSAVEASTFATQLRTTITLCSQHAALNARLREMVRRCVDRGGGVFAAGAVCALSHRVWLPDRRAEVAGVCDCGPGHAGRGGGTGPDCATRGCRRGGPRGCPR